MITKMKAGEKATVSVFFMSIKMADSMPVIRLRDLMCYWPNIDEDRDPDFYRFFTQESIFKKLKTTKTEDLEISLIAQVCLRLTSRSLL